MVRSLILIAFIFVTIGGCEGQLGSTQTSGACYDTYTAEPLTHVWDADGQKWSVQQGTFLGTCAVSVKAKLGKEPIWEGFSPTEDVLYYPTDPEAQQEWPLGFDVPEGWNTRQVRATPLRGLRTLRGFEWY